MFDSDIATILKSVAAPPAFSPDGKRLAWLHFDETIHVYHIPSGKEFQVLELPKRTQLTYAVRQLLFSPDGKKLACLGISHDSRGGLGMDKTISLFDLTTDRYQGSNGHATSRMHTTDIGIYPRDENSLQGAPIAWSPDGKTLADWDHDLLRLWNAETGAGNDLSGGHTGAVADLRISGDGRSLLSLGADRSLRTWDIAKSKLMTLLDLPAEATRAVFVNDQRAAFAMLDTTVHLLELPKGEELFTIGEPEKTGPSRPFVESIRTSSEGNVLALHRWQKNLGLYDLEGRRAFKSDIDFRQRGGLLESQTTLDAIALSPDGKLIVVWIDRSDPKLADPADRMTSAVLVFEKASGELVWTADAVAAGCRGLSFSPNGRTVACISGTGDTVVLFETTTGKERSRFKLPAATLAFSADSSFLAVGTRDGTVKLIDLANGKEIASFMGHAGKVCSLFFGADVELLLSGGADGTVLVWDIRKQVREARRSTRLDAETSKKLWADLADSNATSAFRAIGVLSRAQADGVALLKEHLQPAKEVDAARVDKLIEELDSNDFETREDAFKALTDAGIGARDRLLNALEGKPSLETVKRIETLLDMLKAHKAVLGPARLRELRAVEILQTIGTTDARAILEALAGGAEGMRLTQEASAALKRLPERK
jgi:WD40 repeat protein